MTEIVTRAAKHQGSAFIEVFQNCVVFNDGAWKELEDKATREERIVRLSTASRSIFGNAKNKGVRLKGFDPEVVEFPPDRPAEGPRGPR